MTYKQINGAREVRLWVGQVIVPGVILTTTMMNNPEVCNAIKSKCKKSQGISREQVSQELSPTWALFFLF